MTPEGMVKEMIRRKMKAVYPDAYRFTPIGTKFGQAGVPDAIYCVRGLFVAIEAKTPQRPRPTPHQERNLQAIVKAGGFAAVVKDEADMDGMLEVLAHIFGRQAEAARLDHFRSQIAGGAPIQ